MSLAHAENSKSLMVTQPELALAPRHWMTRTARLNRARSVAIVAPL